MTNHGIFLLHMAIGNNNCKFISTQTITMAIHTIHMHQRVCHILQ